MSKEQALAQVLEVDVESITEQPWGEFESSEEVGTYLVYTEEDRDYQIKEYIEQTAWAFNASFLAGETGLPEQVFKPLNEACENGNEAILALIEKTCGLDSFVEAATDADGYGHFLSPYDGEEQEAQIDGTWYYIYRTS